MQSISQVTWDDISEETKVEFGSVQEKYGTIPNFYKTLANSSASLSGFIALERSLEKGVLSSELREKIALTVSQASECEYCLGAHEILGQSVGLTAEAMADARRAFSPSRRTEAALRFARSIVEKRGRDQQDELTKLYELGFDKEEITEIVATVSWKLFANYFNHIAETDIDAFS